MEKTKAHGTLGRDIQGRDTYDFGARAVLVHQQRIALGIADGLPTPGGPWTVKFEPTPACNIRCHFCAYDTQNVVQLRQIALDSNTTDKRNLGLSKEVVMETLDDIEKGRTTRGIYWAGGGEPLVWPHIVDGLIRSGEFADVFLQTNGTLLRKLINKPDSLHALKLLSVSSYAADDDTYQRVTGRRKLGDVSQNLKEVIRLRNEQRMKLAVNIKIMVSPRNYVTLPDTVAFFRTLGVNSIGIRNTQDFNIGSTGARAESVELSQSERDAIYERIHREYASDQLLISFANSLMVSEATASTRRCYNAVHSHLAVVNPAGEVYLGDPESGIEEYMIGNVNTQPWKSIWGSERHVEVVRRMDEKQRAGLCNLALCRHYKANASMDAYLDKDPGTRPIIDEQRTMDNFGAFM